MLEISFMLLFLSGKICDTFTKGRTLCLKAILPLLVIVSHYCPNIIPPEPNTRLLGIYAVSIFFFISGYGLSYKFNKENHMGFSYFYRKIWNLIIPLLSCSFLYVLTKYLVDGNLPDLNIFHYLYKNEFILPLSWFVITLVVLYIFFYLSIKCRIKRILQLLLLLLFVTSLMLFEKKQGIQSTYFMSDLAFVSGCFAANYKNIPYLSNIYVKRLFYIMVVLLMFVNPTGSVYVNSALLPLAFIFLFCTVKLYKCFLLDLIAKVSYELYLVQSISALIIYSFMQMNFLSFGLILILSVFFAFIMNYVNSYIIKKARI